MHDNDEMEYRVSFGPSVDSRVVCSRLLRLIGRQGVNWANGPAFTVLLAGRREYEIARFVFRDLARAVQRVA